MILFRRIKRVSDLENDNYTDGIKLVFFIRITLHWINIERDMCNKSTK